MHIFNLLIKNFLYYATIILFGVIGYFILCITAPSLAHFQEPTMTTIQFGIYGFVSILGMSTASYLFD